MNDTEFRQWLKSNITPGTGSYTDYKIAKKKLYDEYDGDNWDTMLMAISAWVGI